MSHFIQVGDKVVNVDRISAMTRSGAETLVLLDGSEAMSLPVNFDEVCKAIRLPKPLHWWVDIETKDSPDKDKQ